MEREKLYKLLSSLKNNEEIMIEVKESNEKSLFWGAKHINVMDNDILIVAMYSCGYTNVYDYHKDAIQEDSETIYDYIHESSLEICKDIIDITFTKLN